MPRVARRRAILRPLLASRGRAARLLNFQPDIWRAIGQYRLTLRQMSGTLVDRGRNAMQKTCLLLATVLALPPAVASGQTTEELNSDGKNPENVLTQSMGLDR